jgi:ABC-type molybdenum transport system ATPase subunit/photorepair protein PhrA
VGAIVGHSGAGKSSLVHLLAAPYCKNRHKAKGSSCVLYGAVTAMLGSIRAIQYGTGRFANRIRNMSIYRSDHPASCLTDVETALQNTKP